MVEMLEKETVSDEKYEALAVQVKRVHRLDVDGETKLTGDVPEAFSCLNSTVCQYANVLPTGGTPCSECRHRTAGDYFTPSEK